MFSQRLLTAVALPCSLAVAIGLASADPAGADEQLARQAFEILKTNCQQCHYTTQAVEGFDILDRESLVRARPNKDMDYIVPGDPDNSMLWVRLYEVGDMPPEDVEQRPSEEEIAVIKRWIEDGAAFPKYSGRDFRTLTDTLQEIKNHLTQLPPARRKGQRYFSLVNIYNDPKYSESDLNLYRAAFVKLVNSLSRDGETIYPELIDAPDDAPYAGVIFTLHLDELGWDPQAWHAVRTAYSYGLKYIDPVHSAINADIAQFMGGELSYDGFPFFRVDWFIAHASRPPLYHLLLDLPTTLAELEQRLGVRPETAQRAGFAGSGVSRHNRVLDRMTSRVSDYYYRSYDFDKGYGRAVIFRFPMGPRSPRNPLDRFAFEEAGGEFIWSLRNGMQAYLIVNADGERVDKAPIDIVRDLGEAAGTPEVVNGISCIGCHRQGLRPYRDSVRETRIGDTQLQQAIDRLYIPHEQMTAQIDRDSEIYKSAIERLLGPYLKRGVDEGKSVWDFPEPVSQVAKWYDKDVTLQDAAYELWREDPQILKGSISTNRTLQNLGLGPLAEERGIPRELWDTKAEAGASVFQRTATAIRLGTGVD